MASVKCHVFFQALQRLLRFTNTARDSFLSSFLYQIWKATVIYPTKHWSSINWEVRQECCSESTPDSQPGSIAWRHLQRADPRPAICELPPQRLGNRCRGWGWAWAWVGNKRGRLRGWAASFRCFPRSWDNLSLGAGRDFCFTGTEVTFLNLEKLQYFSRG